MRVHRSALKHGITQEALKHISDHPIVVIDLEPESDPPKVLIIGPNHEGTLIEVIALVLASDELLAIHAMQLRPAFYRFLPDPTE